MYIKVSDQQKKFNKNINMRCINTKKHITNIKNRIRDYLDDILYLIWLRNSVSNITNVFDSGLYRKLV